MRFERIAPCERLRPYIKYFAISESIEATTYKVLPSFGLVMGFQYRGQLSAVVTTNEIKLANAGISGMANSFKTFKNSENIGTILVYFTEVGFAAFSSCPANELFNHSISLTEIFNQQKIADIEEKLQRANTDEARISMVEKFLLNEMKVTAQDQLVIAAVKLIYETKGSLRIKQLNEKLAISQSPFEKRFRKLVGISPKKFSSIVRFHQVLQELDSAKSFAEICYENNYFDQSHLIKDFKQFTGETPENFRLF
ncbi:helix-turn-helix domain-containing protein [Pedobacter helvus]|uniref:Helix-turn-helix domain-containing protein n=1 Tax=Pedobacter helvus TaxID=2563444 RepID=A0ABW9JFP5_9SPHI|nr:helix-turn-helix transcriptional regulator [Pedobacter ureilyticus]